VDKKYVKKLAPLHIDDAAYLFAFTVGRVLMFQSKKGSARESDVKKRKI